MNMPELPPNGVCYRIKNEMYLAFTNSEDLSNSGFYIKSWAEQGQVGKLNTQEEAKLADALNAVIAYWVRVDNYPRAREWAYYREWALGAGLYGMLINLNTHSVKGVWEKEIEEFCGKNPEPYREEF